MSWREKLTSFELRETVAMREKKLEVVRSRDVAVSVDHPAMRYTNGIIAASVFSHFLEVISKMPKVEILRQKR